MTYNLEYGTCNMYHIVYNISYVIYRVPVQNTWFEGVEAIPPGPYLPHRARTQQSCPAHAEARGFDKGSMWEFPKSGAILEPKQ